MDYNKPHTIENCVVEKIIFPSAEQTGTGEKVILEAFYKARCGPAMHTHFKQEEELTVLSGKMGYQLPGQERAFAVAGEKVLFKRGTPPQFPG